MRGGNSESAYHLIVRTPQRKSVSIRSWHKADISDVGRNGPACFETWRNRQGQAERSNLSPHCRTARGERRATRGLPLGSWPPRDNFREFRSACWRECDRLPLLRAQTRPFWPLSPCLALPERECAGKGRSSLSRRRSLVRRPSMQPAYSFRAVWHCLNLKLDRDRWGSGLPSSRTVPSGLPWPCILRP